MLCRAGRLAPAPWRARHLAQHKHLVGFEKETHGIAGCAIFVPRSRAAVTGPEARPPGGLPAVLGRPLLRGAGGQALRAGRGPGGRRGRLAGGGPPGLPRASAGPAARSPELARPPAAVTRRRPSLSPRGTDGGLAVPAQVPAAPARGGSERGRHGGHQPARPRADLHLPRNAVHRGHRLPEHRCKGARRGCARGAPRLPASPRARGRAPSAGSGTGGLCGAL